MKYLIIILFVLGIGMANAAGEDEYIVEIPKERLILVNLEKDEFPVVVIINSALVTFEPKIVFAWHFSITIKARELEDKGMPTAQELTTLYGFEDFLDPIIKSNDNALLLAKVTTKGHRELLYRVYDPEPIDQFLQELIHNKQSPRQFEYRIEEDSKWTKAKWYLTLGAKSMVSESEGSTWINGVKVN